MREWLDRAEEYFDSLDKKQFFALIAGMIILFIGAFWYFTFEPVQQELQSKEKAITDTIKKIRKLSKSTIIQKIQREKRAIAQINQEIEKIKAEQIGLLAQLQKMDYKLLNKENFYQFLTKLLDLSVKSILTLDKIELTPLQKKFVGGISIVQKMDINGSGAFLDTVKWLRTMEDERLLLKVDRFQVALQKDQPSFYISILFYGNSL